MIIREISMKLLLDSNVFEDVKGDKVLSDNLEDLRNTLKEASTELDNRKLSIADFKSFADSYDFIITENRATEYSMVLHNRPWSSLKKDMPR